MDRLLRLGANSSTVSSCIVSAVMPVFDWKSKVNVCEGKAECERSRVGDSASS